MERFVPLVPVLSIAACLHNSSAVVTLLRAVRVTAGLYVKCFSMHPDLRHFERPLCGMSSVSAIWLLIGCHLFD